MKQKNGQESLSKKIVLAKKQAKLAGSFLDEIKKIEWVSKRDVQRYVKIIVVCICVFGFSIYFIDLMFRSLLTFLGNVTSLFFG